MAIAPITGFMKRKIIIDISMGMWQTDRSTLSGLAGPVAGHGERTWCSAFELSGRWVSARPAGADRPCSSAIVPEGHRTGPVEHSQRSRRIQLPADQRICSTMPSSQPLLLRFLRFQNQNTNILSLFIRITITLFYRLCPGYRFGSFVVEATQADDCHQRKLLRRSCWKEEDRRGRLNTVSLFLFLSQPTLISKKTLFQFSLFFHYMFLSFFLKQ